MLHNIHITNFRSLQDFHTTLGDITAIIGNNGAGKTNILQAIFYLFGESIPYFSFEDIIRKGSDFINIEGIFERDNISLDIRFFYDAIKKQKKYFIGGKTTTYPKYVQMLPKVILFSPYDMNLFYLGPKYRRDTLDSTLSKISQEYKTLLKSYQHVLRSRNKVLKSIGEGFASHSDIQVWDEQFITLCHQIYHYRQKYILFIQDFLSSIPNIFATQTTPLQFQYKTKVDFQNITQSISNYLNKNFQRDIILGKTHIGPHIDDFDILINDISLQSYASRGETKAIILELKKCEIQYIYNHTKQYPILLIDDVGSELDISNIQHLISHLPSTQIIYSSISQLEENIQNIFL